MHADPALDALFLPFDDGLLPPPAGGAFLGARAGVALQRWSSAGLACEQDYRPVALAPGGRYFMVANRHLPYEATLAKHFREVRVLADARGFKVFEARR